MFAARLEDPLGENPPEPGEVKLPDTVDPPPEEYVIESLAQVVADCALSINGRYPLAPVGIAANAILFPLDHPERATISETIAVTL